MAKPKRYEDFLDWDDVHLTTTDDSDNMSDMLADLSDSDRYFLGSF